MAFLRKNPSRSNAFFFPHSKLGQIFLLMVSAYMVFRFFGGAGLNRYGEASRWNSALSVVVLLPLAVTLCWPRSEMRPQLASGA
jgi:hypothetical protein